MNKKNSIDYQFLPQIFLRAPYYSFSGYDLARLPEVLREQAFRNAVWLASPGFYRLLEKKEFNFDQLKDKEKHTLYKYYNRMCFRPTPFGSFASFTLLEWGKGRQVKLANNNQAILHLLPDNQLLHELRNPTEVLSATGSLIMNPSLYRFENAFRYTKFIINDEGNYRFALEAIAAVKFNINLFLFIGIKRLAVAEVVQWIMSYGECTENEAMDYIRFLVNEQVIYCNVMSDVICTPFADNRMTIRGWNDFWKNYRSLPLCNNISLETMADGLQQTVARANFIGNTQPFYAALERPAESGGPDVAIQTELFKAIKVLQLLSVYDQPDDLSRFIREFRTRFDREKVPLLTALDPDAGLPYSNMEASAPGAGILENLIFPKTFSENNQLGWDMVQQLLFKLWIGDALRDPWAPLLIREEDIMQLESKKSNNLPLPQTQALLYRDTVEHLIIESAGGVTATSLIGRFSCFSEEVHLLCEELAHLETTANPGVIFADIGQFSNTHVDNINRRLNIYPYEIPLNVYPEQNSESLVYPQDLLLSIQENELILESAHSGKRVIPRLATAYNFRNNHSPVFRLLCDLQFQGIQAGLYFDLESFFPGLQFYPRVSFGRIIFSQAKWNFKEPELTLLTGKAPSEQLETLQDFRKTHHIPRHISMGATDQQLVFDLAHPDEALFFLQCINGLKSTTITEYLVPGRSVLAGKKPMAAQMIAFLAHDKNIFKESRQTKVVFKSHKNRNFKIGSNWLYLKIFCIPRAADAIVAKVIVPFVAGNRNRIKSWFFIRYAEKGYHLRLRIRADEKDLGTLLVALRNKIESSGVDKLIRNYEGDTYRREIERYGPNLIPHVENLFRAGSDLVANVIRLRYSNKIIWSEFELALLTAGKMLSCFIPEYGQQLTYLNEVTNAFISEFKADKQLITGMDNKYREMKTLIEKLFSREVKKTVFKLFLREVAIINHLIETYSPEQRSVLLSDLIHMQLNRTFSVQQRQQELLVYYCLKKYTLSNMARHKKDHHSA